MDKRNYEDLSSLTDEEKLERRRQQKNDAKKRFRQRRKEDGINLDPPLLRKSKKTDEEKRERKADLAKEYRKNMSPEKRERYLQKERDRYQSRKTETVTQTEPLKWPKKPKRLSDETEEQFEERDRKFKILKKQWQSEYYKTYYKNNADKLKQYQKDYVIQNAEIVNAKKAKYRQKNSEILLAKQRQWYKNNCEKVSSTRKRFRESHPSVLNGYDRRYREKLKQDPQRLKAKRDYISRYNRERKAIDSKFAAAATLRRSLNDKLKYYLINNKRHSALHLIGCEIEEFVDYIESKFVRGMTWTPKNFHLDHIKPCNSFDLTDPEQVKLCFHYTNFQPLWPVENMQKHDKLDWKRKLTTENNINE